MSFHSPLAQTSNSLERVIARESCFGAKNYAPLPVVLAQADGAHLFDTSGKRYIDMMSAYSAASFGHLHPRARRSRKTPAYALGRCFSGLLFG